MPTGQSSIIPDKFGVRFRGRKCTGSVTTTVPIFYTKTFNISQIYSDVKGFPGTKWFHDTALAMFAGGGTTPTNQSTLDILAQQIAIDYVNWLLDSFDESYVGIIDPSISGITDTVEWNYTAKGCTTRRYSAAYNSQPEEMMHHDPANSGCVDAGGNIADQTPCIYVWGPPATCVAGRPTMTRYKICFIDGILTQKYVQTDTVT